jgi:hypothetical protein
MHYYCNCFSVRAPTLHTVTVLCMHVEYTDCSLTVCTSHCCSHQTAKISPPCTVTQRACTLTHCICMRAGTLHPLHLHARRHTAPTGTSLQEAERSVPSYKGRKEQNTLYFFFSRGSRRDVHLRCSCACVMPLPVPCFAMIAFAACCSSMCVVCSTAGSSSVR